MAYSKFTIQRLKKEYNIKIIDNTSLLERKEVKPSSWLKETLEIGMTSPLLSEKARSELLIAPILQELRKENKQKISIFSGINLDVDSQNDLNGECDFILVKGDKKHILDIPIFAIVEAKKQDIDLGIAQSIAQIIGAKIFNKNNSNNIKTIFGCVTTGEIWQFMKIEEDFTVIIDTNRFYIDNVPEILGALQQVIDFYK